jgi:DNA-binding beta-propeller fold protein YncE
MRRSFVALLLGSTAACSSNPGGGIGTLQAASGSHALYAALTDHGQLARIDLDQGSTSRIDVGREPMRIAQLDDRVYVTLRAERSVAVLHDTGSTLVLDSRFSVGAEPYGIAATGGKLYVANSESGTVVELDPAGRFLRSWTIPGEPRWLAVHPSGQSLYVGSAFGGLLTRIDLGSGQFESLPLPVLNTLITKDSNSMVSPLSQRITGDPAVSSDGNHLYVPVLYVDNISLVDDSAAIVSNMGLDGSGTPTMGGCSGLGGCGGGSGSGGYVSAVPGMPNAKFQPMVIDMLVSPNSGALVSVDATGRLALDVRGLVTNGVIAGYVSAVVPTQDWIFAAVEGASGVVAISTQRASGAMVAEPVFAGGGVGAPGEQVEIRATAGIATGDGPRGIATTSDGRVFVHAAFDHQLDEIDVGQLRNDAQQSPAALSLVMGPEQGIELLRVTPIAEEILPGDAAAGRRMFYSTVDPHMAVPGAAVSCATCHFEGRNDGLTWHFVRAPDGLQTPPLAGGLIGATPLTWAGDVDSVAHEAFLTSQFRMGGQALSAELASQIEAYVNSTRDIDVDLKGSSDSRIQHGQEIFNRPEVGCGTCHNGARMTNNTIVAQMFGKQSVKVRPLIGLDATAPYLHDGSSATIRDLLERLRNGAPMGDTSSLSSSEMDDLEFYLRSL